MITFKVPSDMYGITDCVITDIDRTLKTGYAPCGSGEDYKLSSDQLEIVKQCQAGFTSIQTVQIKNLHNAQMQHVDKQYKLMKLRLYRKLILILLLVAIAIISQAQVRKSYIALESTYIVLNYADLHLTYKGLADGAREANPAARWLYDKNLLIPGKILVTSGTLWMFRRMYIENPRTAYVYLIAANLIYMGVVANNYVVTLKLRV